MTGIATSALTRATEPIRTVVFYTKGQSLGGKNGDDRIILDTLREGGLDARVVDLSNVSQATDGSLLLKNPETGAVEPWRDPHSALMYHGAIAPPGSMELLNAMKARGTHVVNGPDAWPIFTGKDLFADYMGERGVRIIPSTPVNDPAALRKAVADLDGEAIVKKAVSTEGDAIFPVRSSEDLEHVAAQLPKLGDTHIVQPLIDSRIGPNIEPGIAKVLKPEEFGRRHEFRVNSVRFADGTFRVDAIYMRVAPDENQLVNNVAQGARPIKVEFTDLHPADQKMILAAIENAPPTGDLIGWDVIGQPGNRRIIEGNSGSGLPNGKEGIPPRQIVDSYVRVLREAGGASDVRRRELATEALRATAVRADRTG